MSHETVLETQVRDLDGARQALRNLGIELLGAGRVIFYYDDIAPQEAEETWTFKGAISGYRAGLVRQENGTLSVVYDAWGLNHANAANTGMDKLGRDCGKWVDVEVDGKVGHTAIGKPTRFQQEYILVMAERLARAKGQVARRIAQPTGDILLRVEGGGMPHGTHFEVTAQVDGQAKVAAFGFKGPDCVRHTRDVEAFLGVVTKQSPKADFFHRVRGGVVQHQKVK